jgi:acyl-CoA reductase-like NAD-dependent aldehyde dehydrogenase
MKLTTDIEDEIDAIRDAIYEKIKDMSSEERAAYYNAIAEEARTKYNLRVVKSALENVTEAVYSP